jgi:hypothetical protein
MSTCYCRIILAALVIVFAWWHPSWGNIALTIIGALLLVSNLKRDFCCCSPKKTSE